MPAVVAQPKNLKEESFHNRENILKQQAAAEQEAIKLERKSPFTNFYQINANHSEELIWLVNENSNAFRILLFLFEHMDKYNAVMCSYQVIQEALNIGRTTASNSIRFLKEHGFIHVCKSGTSNVYVTNPEIAWKSWGNNRQYCEFPANIILSSTEQEERLKVKDKRVQTVITKKPKNSFKETDQCQDK